MAQTSSSAVDDDEPRQLLRASVSPIPQDATLPRTEPGPKTETRIPRKNRQQQLLKSLELTGVLKPSSMTRLARSRLILQRIAMQQECVDFPEDPEPIRPSINRSDIRKKIAQQVDVQQGADLAEMSSSSDL